MQVRKKPIGPRFLHALNLIQLVVHAAFVMWLSVSLSPRKHCVDAIHSAAPQGLGQSSRSDWLSLLQCDITRKRGLVRRDGDGLLGFSKAVPENHVAEIEASTLLAITTSARGSSMGYPQYHVTDIPSLVARGYLISRLSR